MKIYLTCPHCGSVEWEKESNEEGEFICERCGSTALPEEMCCETGNDLEV